MPDLPPTNQHVIGYRLTGISPTGEAGSIETGPNQNGERWKVEDATYENETDAMTTARLYVDGPQGKQYLHHQATPAADTIYGLTSQSIYLGQGEVIGLEWTGATAGDVIRFYIRGVREWTE